MLIIIKLVRFVGSLILFKVARLLVMQDGGKLTWVGKLSLAEPLQGR